MSVHLRRPRPFDAFLVCIVRDIYAVSLNSQRAYISEIVLRRSQAYIPDIQSVDLCIIAGKR